MDRKKYEHFYTNILENIAANNIAMLQEQIYLLEKDVMSKNIIQEDFVSFLKVRQIDESLEDLQKSAVQHTLSWLEDIRDGLHSPNDSDRFYAFVSLLDLCRNFSTSIFAEEWYFLDFVTPICFSYYFYDELWGDEYEKLFDWTGNDTNSYCSILEFDGAVSDAIKIFPKYDNHKTYIDGPPQCFLLTKDVAYDWYSNILKKKDLADNLMYEFNIFKEMLKSFIDGNTILSFSVIIDY